MSAPSFDEQVRLLESFLGRPLPGRLRALFMPGSEVARRLLTLATGRELLPLTPGLPPAEAFAEDQAKFDSVLGHAICNAEVARLEPDGVWPQGLLIIEDLGCARYRAVDLESPELRVIDYEYREADSDPQLAAGPTAQLAYAEPVVPQRLQHQFIVVTATLEQWVESIASSRAGAVSGP